MSDENFGCFKNNTCLKCFLLIHIDYIDYNAKPSIAKYVYFSFHYD